MARPKKAVTSGMAIVKHRQTYADDTQTLVEYHFIRGASLHEIESVLQLPAVEVLKRYNQVLKYYQTAANSLDEHWAKVQALCILKQSYQRCDEIQASIRSRVARDPDYVPLKEYQSIREEQKLIYKISADIRKEYAKPQIEGTREVETETHDPGRGQTIRQRFKEVISSRNSVGYSMTRTEEKDLEEAVTSASVFDDEEDF